MVLNQATWTSVMKLSVFLISLVIPTCLTVDETGNRKLASCLATVETVLEHNSPELLVIPNEDEMSIFTSNRVHISVTWSHMDALLTDKSCVASYLLEYGLYRYERNKRESVLSSALISPALNPDTTSYNIVLDDDCKIYSVHIVVIPSLTSSDLMYSQPRRFWPAAYRTLVDTFSDSAVVSWPATCSYVTAEWQLEACPDGQTDRCAIVRLNGESPIHLAGLQSCKVYHFRLRAPAQYDKHNQGEILWTFPAARTLPKPDVDIAAGHTSLHVTIRQGDDCDESAYVKHWRVTYCTRAASEEDARKHYYDDVTGREAGSGVGDDDEEEADDEYYYYEDGNKSNKQKQTKCTNKLYTLSKGKADFTIEGLSECTMYTVDLSPADASGHVLQPGEDYGSVHSTFCMNKEQSSNFWFGDENNNNNNKGENDITQQKPSESDESETIAVHYLVLMALGGLTCVAIIIGAAWWLIHKTRGPSKVKHIRCPSEEEASPKRALIRVTDVSEEESIKSAHS